MQSAERARDANDRGATADAVNAVVDDRLGGGSDYAVFLNHLGVPSADVAFDGRDPTYHTPFDTHDYVERAADPGFIYTTTLARLMGVAAMRLSGAEIVPIDPVASASSARSYLREVGPSVGRSGEASLRGVEAALDDFRNAAHAIAASRDSALRAADSSKYPELNRRLLQLERSFVDDGGLPGREWYKHVLMAPARSYQPLVLPGLAEALDSGDSSRFASQAERLAAALRRASALLGGR